MSGTWSERAEAGSPLKPGDVGNALKDLAVALRAVQSAVVELDGRDEVLAKRLGDNEAMLADVVSRLVEFDTAVKPAKSQGGKAAGGSS